MHTVASEIERIRESWGARLLILGHHYQRSEVVAHADAIGDSLELARKAASHPEAERIVFCGVHFMAESADILSGREQAVFMPETGAGCPMANMAAVGSLEQAWDAIGGDASWAPIVYVNSTAAIKAFCGRHGGSACTSSNAPRVFAWALDQGKRILFLPDEHLGTNTAHDLGIPDEQIAVFDPGLPLGGIGRETLAQARVLVWKGFCLVHTAFTRERIATVRRLLPDARIIVHPEAPKEVVRAADAHGSTAEIVDYVAAAEDGATIVIGTELNLVQRLADLHRGRVTVKALHPSLCANMAKITARNLLDLLRDWPDGCRVRVDETTAADARGCLATMLAL
jgi:quinolinate synthase